MNVESKATHVRDGLFAFLLYVIIDDNIKSCHISWLLVHLST